jgi:hypothetical protein
MFFVEIQSQRMRTFQARNNLNKQKTLGGILTLRKILVELRRRKIHTEQRKILIGTRKMQTMLGR